MSEELDDYHDNIVNCDIFIQLIISRKLKLFTATSVDKETGTNMFHYIAEEAEILQQ